MSGEDVYPVPCLSHLNRMYASFASLCFHSAVPHSLTHKHAWVKCLFSLSGLSHLNRMYASFALAPGSCFSILSSWKSSRRCVCLTVCTDTHTHTHTHTHARAHTHTLALRHKSRTSSYMRCNPWWQTAMHSSDCGASDAVPGTSAYCALVALVAVHVNHTCRYVFLVPEYSWHSTLVVSAM